MDDINLENIQAQMRKGTLEFATLLIISRSPAYASDILKELKDAKLIVVEGTLYPLLTRLKNAALLEYSWQESSEGPPRKYYTITKKGKETLAVLSLTWENFNKSINHLIKKYE